MPHRLQNPKTLRAALAAAVFLAAFLSVALTLTDYGLGWDENIDAASARLAEQWFRLPAYNPQGEAMFSESTLHHYWGADAKHPAVTRAYYALVHIAVVPLSKGLLWREVYSWRIGSALLFAALATGVFLVGSALFGMAGGVVAAAALAGMPHVFGIAHIQCTDLLLTTLCFFAAWAFVGGLECRGRAALFGVLVALMPAVKLTGAVAAVPFFVWALATRPRKIGWNLLAIAVVAPVVFILAQPGSWHHPIAQTLQYWHEHTALTTVKYIHVPYFGGIYDARPPWHYAPVMTALTVPLPILIMAVMGIVGMFFGGNLFSCKKGSLQTFLQKTLLTGEGANSNAGIATETQNTDEFDNPNLKEACHSRVSGNPQNRFSHENSCGNERNRPFRMLSFIIMNSIFYVAVFCVPRIPVYDGVRLFLMVFPFIALLAGAGFAAMGSLLPVAARAGAAIVLMVLMLAPVWRVHPYELSYYNALIGGLSGAADRGMEVTYWGEVLNPSVLDRVNRALPTNAVLSVAGSNPYNFDTYYDWGLIRRDIRVVPYGTEFQYILLVSRTGSFDPLCRMMFQHGRPMFRVTHDGVPEVSLYHVVKR